MPLERLIESAKERGYESLLWTVISHHKEQYNLHNKQDDLTRLKYVCDVTTDYFNLMYLSRQDNFP